MHNSEYDSYFGAGGGAKNAVAMNNVGVTVDIPRAASTMPGVICGAKSVDAAYW